MGLRPVEAGWLLTVLTVPMLLLPRLGAMLASRLAAAVFFPMGLAIIAVADMGLAAIVWSGSVQSVFWPVILGLLGSGTGAALIQSQTSAAAIGAVPGGRAAMASAISVTMRQLGFSLGIALLGCLLQAGGEHGFALAFFGAGVFTLMAALICRGLNRR